jgi:hypothetical protein
MKLQQVLTLSYEPETWAKKSLKNPRNKRIIQTEV